MGSNNTLVVIAHPDDEVLGCGATISKLSQKGHNVSVLLSLKRSDKRGIENWDSLLQQFEKSCCILGATPIVLPNLMDETEAETHVHHLHDKIVAHIDDSTRIITHQISDVNQAHRGIHRAVEIATRPFRRRREVWLCEIATSSDQKITSGQHQFPNLFVEISKHDLEKKILAMENYLSESAVGRRGKDIIIHAQYWGSIVGFEYAEPFYVARMFK
ncbi:MAG: hypothetical protein CMJ80_00455 [Planctomycetaceae bacterium]|nr:hypothetical protein [Planctomycetaceae bacterium]